MADPHASGKTNCFVGVCIQRGGHGLGATFVLRNNIDGQGMEICYELYSLKLEKRLDNTLMYPRDALPEYSTVDLDMKPVPHSVTGDVPVNKVAGSDYCLTLPLARLNTHFGSSLLYQSAYVSEASDGSGPSTMSRSSACCCPLRTLAGVRHHRPGGTHTQGGANVPQTPHPDPLSQPGVCSSGNRWAADSFKTVNDVESNPKYFIHSMSN